MLSRSRRSGSGSTTLANSQRMELGGIGRCSRRIHAPRQDPLQQPPKNAAQANIHFPYGEDVAGPVVVAISMVTIVDAHHFAAGDVDDLLIQQVAGDAQHVFVVVVGGELLVAELDAPVQGDGADLIVADGQPGVAAAHQVTVDAGGMFQGNEGGVFDTADAVALEV